LAVTLSLPKVRADARVLRIVARWVPFACFIALLSYLVVLPLVELQVQAFSNGAAGYRDAYTFPGTSTTLIHTAWLGAGGLAIALVLGTALAWWSIRLPPKARFLRVIPVLPLVTPGVGSVLGWSYMLSPGPGYLNVLLRKIPIWSSTTSGPIDIYSFGCIVAVTGIILTSFVYLFVSAGFANVDADYLAAARISGASSFRTFIGIAMPLSRPAILYGGGVALLLGIGQFIVPAFLGASSGVQTLTTEMLRSISNVIPDYGAAAAYGSPLLVAGIIILIIQRIGLGDQKRFITHSGRAFTAPSSHSSRLSIFGISVYGLLATAIPLIGLVLVTFSINWTGHVDFAHLTLRNLAGLSQDSDIRSAIWTSLTASLIAVAIAIPVGYVSARIMLRGSSPVMRTLVDIIVTIPLAMPVVLFGVGMLLVYIRPPIILYGSSWVFVVVYVTLMLPFATRIMLGGMMSLGATYQEASRVCGGGPLRTELRIHLPLLRPTLGAAGALMYALLIQEFAASILVAAPTSQVMGTILYQYWIQPNLSYNVVAPMALIMFGVSVAGVAVALVVGGGDVTRRL
jgi:iron(III) transport system permease protein